MVDIVEHENMTEKNERRTKWEKEDKSKLSLVFVPNPKTGEKTILLLALDGKVIPGQCALSYENTGSPVKSVTVRFEITD